MKLFTGLLAIGLAFASCDIGQDSDQAATYILPVQYVTGNESLTAGDTVSLAVGYSRPNDCHIFNGFSVSGSVQSQIIAVTSVVFNQGDCVNEPSIYEVPFKFVSSQPGSYELKFWTGNDASGQPEYITRTVTVGNTN